MLIGVMMNQQRTEAVMHYTDREAFTLYSASGRVDDMVNDILSPISDLNCTQLAQSLEDTASIPLAA
jgi:hypothetical protein